MRRFVAVTALAVAGVICLAAAPGPQSTPREVSASLNAWKKAVAAGDSAAITALYSAAPRIIIPSNKTATVPEEASFWADWKAKGLTNVSTEINERREAQPGVHMLVFQTVLTVKSSGAAKKYYVATVQAWAQEGGAWRIRYEQRSNAAGLRQPTENKDIYPQNADVKAEIADAVKQAAAQHKRVLLVFGGNWCFDCHVLDEAFHSPEIAPALNRSYEVVHVDIGEYNKNLDIADKYEIPLKRGVPAIAVLDADGKLLYSQKGGEFEATRKLATEDILEFLNKWKPNGNAKS
jgi:ketosteroid isomerase-like protein